VGVGVTSGSPADRAGIGPGDIVTRVEGVSVGSDGTMRDYCDVMRTHSAGDVLAVESCATHARGARRSVQRRHPVDVFSFADTFDDTVDQSAGTSTPTTSRHDDSGTLSVSVPRTGPMSMCSVDIDGVSSPSIVASSDVDAFNSNWDVPGVQFVASTALVGSPPTTCSIWSHDECTSEGARLRRRRLHRPVRDLLELRRHQCHVDCRGRHSADGSIGVLVVVQVVSEADLIALDEVLRSFDVIA